MLTFASGSRWPAACVRGRARKLTLDLSARPIKVSLRRPEGKPGPGQYEKVAVMNSSPARTPPLPRARGQRACWTYS